MMSRAELRLRNYFLKSLLNYATTADNYGEKRKTGRMKIAVVLSVNRNHKGDETSKEILKENCLRLCTYAIV